MMIEVVENARSRTVRTVEERRPSVKFIVQDRKRPAGFGFLRRGSAFATLLRGLYPPGALIQLRMKTRITLRVLTFLLVPSVWSRPVTYQRASSTSPTTATGGS